MTHSRRHSRTSGGTARPKPFLLPARGARTSSAIRLKPRRAAPGMCAECAVSPSQTFALIPGWQTVGGGLA